MPQPELPKLSTQACTARDPEPPDDISQGRRRLAKHGVSHAYVLRSKPSTERWQKYNDAHWETPRQNRRGYPRICTSSSFAVAVSNPQYKAKPSLEVVKCVAYVALSKSKSGSIVII